MWIYISVFTLLFFFSFVEIFSSEKKCVPYLWIVSFLFLVLHDGLRWETGTDWTNYLKFFESSLGPNSVSMEIGYTWLNQCIYSLTGSFTVFLLFHAVFIYSLIFGGLKKYSTFPLLSLALYYCMMLPYLGMNRQFISLALCFYAIRFIIQKSALKFYVFIIIACLFHKSAIVFSLAFFLNRDFSKYFYLGLLSIALIISFSGIVQKIPSVAVLLLDESSAYKIDKYAEIEMGLQNVSLLSSMLSYLKRMVWLIPFFFMRRYFPEDSLFRSRLFVNMYYVSLLFYIIFNNSALQIVVGRGLIYYNIAEAIIIPYLLYIFRANISQYVFFALLIFYSFINLNKGLAAYHVPGEDDIFVPYKGIFINTDYHRTMF